MTQLYKNLQIEKAEASKLKIKAKVDASSLHETEDKILEEKRKNMVIPGFRKGEAPKDLVLKQLDPQTIKEEAAKELAAQALAQIIVENQLKVVGNPNIVLGELKDGQDIELEADILVLPEAKIKDNYKEAVAKINTEPQEEVVVTDEDVDKVILHLRREKARILTLETMQKNPDKKIEMPDFNQIPEEKLPQLDEKDFKELAGAENMDDFKQKVKENIKTEKELAQKEARRAKIAEELLKHVEIEMPDEIVQMELDRAKMQMEQDLQMMGLTLDAYLAQIGKNKEEFENEMKEAARKRAILQIVLDTIAKEQNITPDPEEVKKEAEHILQHTPQANPQEVYAFVDAQISNNKVFEYLESLK